MASIYYEGLRCEYDDDVVKYKGYILHKKCNSCKKFSTIQIKKNGWAYAHCKNCRLKKSLQKQKKNECIF